MVFFVDISLINVDFYNKYYFQVLYFYNLYINYSVNNLYNDYFPSNI